MDHNSSCQKSKPTAPNATAHTRHTAHWLLAGTHRPFRAAMHRQSTQPTNSSPGCQALRGACRGPAGHGRQATAVVKRSRDARLAAAMLPTCCLK